MPNRLYRTMEVAADGRPASGRASRTLGVRVAGPHADVHPDAAGRVRPGEGMSAIEANRFPSTVYSLMPHLLPTAYGGTAREPLWWVDDHRVTPPLAVRPSGHPHMQVEPSAPMPLQDYEDALERTRDDWSVA